MKTKNSPKKASVVDVVAKKNPIKRNKEIVRFSNLIDQMPLMILMESLGEGIIATDMEGRIGMVNKCAEKMFGISENDVQGQPFSDVFDIYDKLGARVQPQDFLVAKVLRSKRKANESTYYYATAHKKKFPAAVTTAPIMVYGQIIGTASIFRSMRKEAEVDKAKTEFVSLASHQLRTPLTSIKLFTEILLSKHPDAHDEERQILENIEHSNEKMIRLVNNLLNVAHMEAGRLKVEPTSVSVYSLVANVLDEIRPVARDKGVDIEYSHGNKSDLMIETDTNLLRQIFNNIVTNAVEYSPRKSKVTVRVSSDDRFFCISVQDRGIGIEKEAQKEVFNRFFRAPNAVKFKTESTGLGLYVSKMMVEALGGHITFSTAEGKGTTFFINVPFHPPLLKS